MVKRRRLTTSVIDEILVMIVWSYSFDASFLYYWVVYEGVNDSTHADNRRPMQNSGHISNIGGDFGGHGRIGGLFGGHGDGGGQLGGDVGGGHHA